MTDDRGRLVDRLTAASRRGPRPSWTTIGALLLAVAVLAVVGAAIGGWSRPTPPTANWMKGNPTLSASASPPSKILSFRAHGVEPELSPPPGEFTAWAVLDRRTGNLTGSWNRAETSTTASMIKAWIVADELRRATEAGRQVSQQRLEQLRVIVRDSNNELTESAFQALGAHKSIERLINICGLTDSHPVRWLWSNTRLSARDTARMGACIADGRAAGAEWTDWLLDEMRAVRGIGDFGIRAAFPPEIASQIAIKNGWVIRTQQHEYHVNCLAISADWTMGVLTRYPAHLGYKHGAEICQALATEHLPAANQ